MVDCALSGRPEGILNQDVFGPLVGSTEDGLAFRAEIPIIKRLLLGGEPIRLIAFSGPFVVGDENWEGSARLRFGVANFRFIGTEWEITRTEEREEGSRSLMTFELSGRRLAVRWIPGYNEAEAALRARGRVELTCEVETGFDEKQELITTTELVDDLCDLMSVARGTLVDWFYREIQSSDGAVVSRFHKSPPVHGYTGPELIRFVWPDETKRFIETAFPWYRERNELFQLRRVVRAFTDVRGSGFLETRALVLVVLLEYLAGVLAREHERSTYLPDDAFEAKQGELADSLRNAFREAFPSLPGLKDMLQAAESKVKELNRRSLRSKIRSLASEVRLELDDSEIKSFVEIRDRLVHYMDFSPLHERKGRFFAMLHLLDRLLLRLLNYEGRYINCESLEEAELRASPR